MMEQKQEQTASCQELLSVAENEKSKKKSLEVTSHGVLHSVLKQSESAQTGQEKIRQNQISCDSKISCKDIFIVCFPAGSIIHQEILP
jgi:hypothetical protein